MARYNGKKGGRYVAYNWTAEEVEDSKLNPVYNGITWQQAEPPAELPESVAKDLPSKRRKAQDGPTEATEAEPESRFGDQAE